jgi:hypothetical protein
VARSSLLRPGMIGRGCACIFPQVESTHSLVTSRGGASLGMAVREGVLGWPCPLDMSERSVLSCRPPPLTRVLTLVCGDLARTLFHTRCFLRVHNFNVHPPTRLVPNPRSHPTRPHPTNPSRHCKHAARGLPVHLACALARHLTL